MKQVSRVVRWSIYLILPISTFAVDAAHAANSPKICNQTNTTISVAIAWWSSTGGGVHTWGYRTLQPGACDYPFPADSYTAHRYYIAMNQSVPQRPDLSRVWTSDTYQGGQLVFTGSENFCIYPVGTFEFADAYNSCSPPNMKRGFVHIEEGADNLGLSGTGEDSDVYVTEQNGRLGGATW
jgi:hypothetical protein